MTLKVNGFASCSKGKLLQSARRGGVEEGENLERYFINLFTKEGIGGFWEDKSDITFNGKHSWKKYKLMSHQKGVKGLTFLKSLSVYMILRTISSITVLER